MTKKNLSLQQVDVTMAKVLHTLRQIRRHIEAGKLKTAPVHRTRTPGPLSYQRMSLGQLATAALAGAVLYHWSAQEQDVFDQEMQDRGLLESMKAWHTDAPDPGFDSLGALAMPRFDALATRLRAVTATSIQHLAGAIDEVLQENHYPPLKALSPAELLEDMHLAGMDPEAIEAFEKGVGSSIVSPNDEIRTQLMLDQPVDALEGIQASDLTQVQPLEL